MSVCLRSAAMLALAGGIALATAIEAATASLPSIGPAADFTLDSSDGKTLSLSDLRGKVVVVAFVYTTCRDVCQTETAKLAAIAKRLGSDFDTRVHFVAITLDPAVDSPAVLRKFAQGHGANAPGWTFLTGAAAAIHTVAGRYGVVFRRGVAGEVEHNTVTSIVDQRGQLRVQYLGTEFDPGEMLADIRSLLTGSGP
jgi:protein SCO1/2